jgi:hypothetical protein
MLSKHHVLVVSVVGLLVAVLLVGSLALPTKRVVHFDLFKTPLASTMSSSTLQHRKRAASIATTATTTTTTTAATTIDPDDGSRNRTTELDMFGNLVQTHQYYTTILVGGQPFTVQVGTINDCKRYKYQ